MMMLESGDSPVFAIKGEVSSLVVVTFCRSVWMGVCVCNQERCVKAVGAVRQLV